MYWVINLMMEPILSNKHDNTTRTGLEKNALESRVSDTIQHNTFIKWVGLVLRFFNPFIRHTNMIRHDTFAVSRLDLMTSKSQCEFSTNLSWFMSSSSSITFRWIIRSPLAFVGPKHPHTLRAHIVQDFQGMPMFGGYVLMSLSLKVYWDQAEVLEISITAKEQVTYFYWILAHLPLSVNYWHIASGGHIRWIFWRLILWLIT